MPTEKNKKNLRLEKTKKVSDEQMSQMRERLNQKIREFEKEYFKQNPNKNLRPKWLKQIVIARKTGYSPGYISGVLHGPKEITVDVLVAFKNAFGISSDYILHGTSSGTVPPQIATSISKVRELIDQVGTQKGSREHQGLLALPIIHLDKPEMIEGLKPGIVIIPNRVRGRRKNFIPLRIDGENQINVILFEDHLTEQTQE